MHQSGYERLTGATSAAVPMARPMRPDFAIAGTFMCLLRSQIPSRTRNCLAYIFETSTSVSPLMRSR